MIADETKRSADEGVGSSWSLAAITALASFAVVVLVIGLSLWLGSRPGEASIRLATGPQQGSYHLLGEALARVLAAEKSIGVAQEITTEGTIENLSRLTDDSSERSVEFAFAQSDAAFSEDVRLIASLYDEYWHVLVSRGAALEIRRLSDVSGRKLWMGSAGSGTRQFSRRTLEHFGIDTRSEVSLPLEELGGALADGRVEVAFLLTGMPSPLVRDLCDRGVATFLSLGDATREVPVGEADALHAVFPSLSSVIIPRGTYGRAPDTAARTVAVSALLVTREDVDESLVRTVTRTMFHKRARLIAGGPSSKVSVARHIRERYEPGRSTIPYHDGAISYYRRDRPHFIIQYAEALSLGMTVFVAVVSLVISASQFLRRRRKNRIDTYYREVEACARQVRQASDEELLEIRERLEELRSRAFTDLVRERLEANESFIIFQDFLREEVSSVERRLEGRERSR